jgi:hypothetical protein
MARRGHGRDLDGARHSRAVHFAEIREVAGSAERVFECIAHVQNAASEGCKVIVSDGMHITTITTYPFHRITRIYLYGIGRV